MTTVLSNKGQIVIPSDLRKKLELEPGDDFEFFLDDEDIVLRRITKRPNEGLVEHLLACPYPLEIPDRSKELPREVSFEP